MKLLVDNQLPVALARFIAGRGIDCRHVRDVELDSSSDEVIWRYAKENNYIVVSKDDDFQILANRRGTPPQVVWVRLGNCRKGTLLDVFGRVLPELMSTLANGSGVVEIR